MHGRVKSASTASTAAANGWVGWVRARTGEQHAPANAMLFSSQNKGSRLFSDSEGYFPIIVLNQTTMWSGFTPANEAKLVVA